MSDVYALRVEDDVDIYGQSKQRDRIVGIFSTAEKAEETIRQMYANPYFSGSVSVVVFEMDKDMSVYSKYFGTKIERSK